MLEALIAEGKELKSKDGSEKFLKTEELKVWMSKVVKYLDKHKSKSDKTRMFLKCYSETDVINMTIYTDALAVLESIEVVTE